MGLTTKRNVAAQRGRQAELVAERRLGQRFGATCLLGVWVICKYKKATESMSQSKLEESLEPGDRLGDGRNRPMTQTATDIHVVAGTPHLTPYTTE